MPANHPEKPSHSIVIGRLGAPYGIKGWLHLISYTDPPDNIFDYTDWHLQKTNQLTPIKIDSYRQHGKGHVIKLTHINDREAAMQHKGLDIVIDRAQLPTTEADEYYWSDLIGLTVITTTGQTLGIVDYLFETGSNDVIVTKGEKQHFIPYIDDVIKKIDLANHTIQVDWEPI